MIKVEFILILFISLIETSKLQKDRERNEIIDDRSLEMELTSSKISLESENPLNKNRPLKENTFEMISHPQPDEFLEPLDMSVKKRTSNFLKDELDFKIHLFLENEFELIILTFIVSLVDNISSFRRVWNGNFHCFLKSNILIANKFFRNTYELANIYRIKHVRSALSSIENNTNLSEAFLILRCYLFTRNIQVSNYDPTSLGSIIRESDDMFHKKNAEFDRLYENLHEKVRASYMKFTSQSNHIHLHQFINMILILHQAVETIYYRYSQFVSLVQNSYLHKPRNLFFLILNYIFNFVASPDMAELFSNSEHSPVFEDQDLCVISSSIVCLFVLFQTKNSNSYIDLKIFENLNFKLESCMKKSYFDPRTGRLDLLSSILRLRFLDLDKNIKSMMLSIQKSSQESQTNTEGKVQSRFKQLKPIIDDFICQLIKVVDLITLDTDKLKEMNKY